MTTHAPATGNRKLTIDDIDDIRAYERDRDVFRQHVIELKRKRRVGVGPFISFVFENRDTVRFQIQEMARVEKIASDEGIQTELDIYNPLVPDPGELCATMFIELTSEAQLREWLPKLVGVERAVAVRAADGRTVRPRLEAQHASQLTREHTTSCVHYLQWSFGADDVEAFLAGSLELQVDHANYTHAITLSAETTAELAIDLRP